MALSVPAYAVAGGPAKGGVDHLTGGGVGAPVRYLMTPAVKLPVQILQVVELPGQEEVLTDITKRPLHLAF